MPHRQLHIAATVASVMFLDYGFIAELVGSQRGNPTEMSVERPVGRYSHKWMMMLLHRSTLPMARSLVFNS
ncbi:MAG: hypothetical protein NVS2B7_39830 [Herpetosiphon sp.]